LLEIGITRFLQGRNAPLPVSRRLTGNNTIFNRFIEEEYKNGRHFPFSKISLAIPEKNVTILSTSKIESW